MDDDYYSYHFIYIEVDILMIFQKESPLFIHVEITPVTKIKLQWKSKFPSEVINIAAPKVIIKCHFVTDVKLYEYARLNL